MNRLLIAFGLVLAAGGAGVAQPPSAPPSPAPAALPDLAALPDFGKVTLSGITWVKIPAGTFTRGTTEAERAMLEKAGHWRPQHRVEMPARTVTISRPFLLSATEVTQDQWTSVMGGKNPSAFKGGSLPVESVSWDDTQEFCHKLRDRDKATYRLLTEAEWEYAARAGGSDPWGLGADKQPVTLATLAQYGWINPEADNKTHPVGTKTANAWGLHDLLGSVWEWCQDAYSPTAYAETAPTDPRYENKEATERVLRGGCWFLDARAVRVALRGGNLPGFRSPYVGFRLVRELP